MQRFRSKRNFVALTVLALLLTVALPATSFGKDRGRRNGRNRDFDRWKCGKFINCHDARDGRWDGRGRRRNSISVWNQPNVWRDNRWRNNQSNNRWWISRLRDNRWGNDRFDNRRWTNRFEDRRWRDIGSRNVRWRRN